MASSTLLSCKAPFSVRAQAAGSSGGRGNGTARSPNWWAPLFKMSAEPDYIEASVPSEEKAARGRSYGAFTEEKAKVLRKKMLETQTYHDAMYHSAIASRLASDTSC